MPRYFTRDEAEHVLPQVEQLLREALYLKQQYVEADEALKTKTREITMSGGMAVDSQAMLLVQRRRDSAAERLPAVMDAIQEHGCVVKDLDTGLLDFRRSMKVAKCTCAGAWASRESNSGML
jgi:hypothetical protein